MKTIVTLLVISIVSTSASFAQQVMDLGQNVFPRKISNSGEVVGTFDSGAMTKPFLWANGTMEDFAPADWAGGVALGINSTGVVCGQAVYFNAVTPFRPYIWDSAKFTYLGTANTMGGATAINDNGVVAGFLQDLQSSLLYAFVDENGLITRLPDLGGNYSAARSINTSDLIVGDASTSTGQDQPTLWNKQNGIWTVSLLPLGGGANGVATKINDSGQVIGFVDRHAATWQQRQTGYALSYLPVPNGFSSGAFGINKEGQIVGDMSDPTNQIFAFLYSNGAVITLDALAASTGWHFSEALDINDSDDIVGRGVPPGAAAGEFHGYVLHIQQTPSQIIDAMAAAINRLNLNSGTAQSLQSKLRAILDELNRGTPAACNQVNAFVNEVNAQDGKKLTPQEAAELRSRAAALASALHC